MAETSSGREDPSALVEELRIANSRLSDESSRRRRWSAALAEVSSALLTGDDDCILDLIADRVASLVSADFVSVITPQHGTELFVVRAVHGDSAGWIRGKVLEPDETLAPKAMAQRRAMVLDDVDWVPGLGSIGPMVMMPLLAAGDPIGALSVARRHGSPPFRGTELAMVSEFGRQAAVAVELARTQADSRRLELVEERNRIARDLHDHVIQRLFAAGLTLTRAGQSADERTATIINAQVDSIDAAISDIRTVVTTLRTSPADVRDTLRVRAMKVMNEFASAFSRSPRFTSHGPLDLFVSDDIIDEILAVVRELVSNAAQHANARSCSVDLALADEQLVVTVTDDGRGIDASAPRSGLHNLTERARILNGGFDIARARLPGTVARWWIPLTVEGGQ